MIVKDKLAAEDSHQGWLARLDLGFQKKSFRTVLARRRRTGPLSVQRAFYPEGDICHVYLLHPPGGVVGGDRLETNVECDSQSHALLTTPGATKFYRSAGERVVQLQVFNVADNAVLEWLPQESIYFPGARVASSLTLNLQGSANVALWEIHCLGRPVIDEKFDDGQLDIHWKIFREDKPVLIERLRVSNDSLKRLSLLNNKPVVGTFIISNANGAVIESIQQQDFSNKSESLATTLIDDFLVVRYLGNSTENAKQYFLNIWSTVRKPCLGHDAVVPRIWNT